MESRIKGEEGGEGREEEEGGEGKKGGEGEKKKEERGEKKKEEREGEGAIKQTAKRRRCLGSFSPPTLKRVIVGLRRPKLAAAYAKE